MEEILFTAIKGIKVGHAENLEAATGCTVILCEEGAVGGVDVRGGAPGTRETELLNPLNLVEKLHAVLLAGGSAFGLDAAAGVMSYLEEKGIGFDVGVTTVPIVGAAVLFDLLVGDYKIRPDKEMGYKACENASSQPPLQGTIGAGTGATIGKCLGPEYAMKGGVGSYGIKVGDLMVAALVAVNSFGDVVDPSTGEVISGALSPDGLSFANTEKVLLQQYNNNKNLFTGNTTIGVIATNGKLTKAGASKVASMAHNGYARSIRPAHTMVDGDTIFTMATGEVEADISATGLLAAKVMEEAVVRAVKHATSLDGLKCYADCHPEHSEGS
ncbi:L-aminopeptidase/D-esterase [Clostridium aceticum]|uniref:L-aminopeptidase/D-esterase n=1 Tax=Clostridium aceticum TaxID=84022 RepID=A0A0D8I597_9CLOT|nr:P1 family peptidase [Clostridium aceticum]AKL97121.1 L-aminopeptidase/D-esterase [Clostridium aceticum]KJF25408.1 peptidase [Clostridium aceticum]